MASYTYNSYINYMVLEMSPVTLCTSQFSSVHFDLITQECCISNTEEVFMQVLGPSSGGW